MKRGKSSISKAKSYKEIGEFWDTHDLSDFWDQTKRVKFEVGIESEITYYSLDKKLAREVQSIAQKRGVSADTLSPTKTELTLPGTELLKAGLIQGPAFNSSD